jgi:hypothetical protein
MGISGDTLREALLALRPKYGNIAEEKVELNGLLYVIERLQGLKNVDLLTLLLMKGIQNSFSSNYSEKEIVTV